MVLIFGDPEPLISCQTERDNRDFLAEQQANTAEPHALFIFWGSSHTLMLVKKL